MTVVYQFASGLYVNITNRCSNNCVFCVRNFADTVGDALSLWLPQEPSLEEIWAGISARDLGVYDELVFCGFGEPTERLDVLLAVAALVKETAPSLLIRINTNGMGNLIAGEDITPRFKGLIDTVSVSLNAARAADYEAICRPAYTGAFEGLLEFTRQAAKYVPHTVMTVVAGVLPEQDIERCRALAASCGAVLRVRSCI